MHVDGMLLVSSWYKNADYDLPGGGLLRPVKRKQNITSDDRHNQDVTCRSKSIIENVVDKSIVLDVCQ